MTIASIESMKECIEPTLHAEARAPRSTYRLQLHAGFTFADARKILSYLKRLGIGDYYLSPVFEARPGSMHGYDVTRHDQFNPELGGDEEFQLLAASIREAGMGLLLDTVPNHMAIGNDSIWFQDVLENGRASEYSGYFDIDWSPVKPEMRGKLLLPILGNQYGEALENKQIQVTVDDGVPRVRYYDHSMPLAPRSLALLFPQEEDQALGIPQSFRDLLQDLIHMPPHDTEDPALAAQRREQWRSLKPRMIEELRSPAMQPILERVLQQVNGVEGDAASFDQLHRILEAQPYRLSYWRVSSEEINYRRFFDVNELVGLRMENPVVFADTHCLIRRILADKLVTGLRIDHCDGMFDPRQYLIRLQLLYVASQCGGPTPIGPVAPNGIEVEIREAVRGYDWTTVQGPLYVVVEKILEPREALPREWPVQGTSGYVFTYLGNQVFIQQQNEKAFNTLYTQVLGRSSDPVEIIYRAKLQVMQNALSSETYVLTNLLSHLASENRRARDFTNNILETVIRETIACFPVYRTYIDDRGQYTERDRAFIHHAVARAKHYNSDIDASAFDFLEETLLLHGREGEEIDQRELYFALKFQQLTGPVMAKGVEDTAFYVYNRFISSNEVGSSIQSFGLSIETFHAANAERLERSPDTMLGSSTHDTKRSEDVRNRLNVLSEIPQRWAAFVRRAQRANAKFKRTLDDGRIAPDANEEYMIYQTILGAWPWLMDTDEDRKNFVTRLKDYLAKALSEAKVNLSWINPNEEYLSAVHGFIEDILVTKGMRPAKFVKLLEDLLPAARLFGAMNSLSQVVLKATSPGVPDFYQGSEMWDLSLVDPDNRRPIDFEARDFALSTLEKTAAEQGAIWVCNDVMNNLADGRVKLWATARTLAVRNRMPEAFRRGNYTAVYSNESSDLIAFFRQNGNEVALIVAPRFTCTLMQGKPNLPIGDAWGNATITLPGLENAELQNTFTDERVTVPEDGKMKVRDLLAHFPVAILYSV
ncbi:malto-oligosyltrehalose synthase [Silvibacterium acidisoli]|uniref:malto-oligosyltrehalose synthase n=1 Tax=Acidobacteriaceae bacterium ZG23-2 TaxID=2883246 RepID=UPI00406C3C7A